MPGLCVPHVEDRTQPALVVQPALASPGPSCKWDPGLEIQGGNGAAGALGAAPGSSSQDSQLHPLGPQLAPPPHPASGLEAPADLAGSFPRTTCLGLGSPLVGSPGSIRVATALNLTWRIYLQPRKMYLQPWVRFSPSGGHNNLHF